MHSLIKHVIRCIIYLYYILHSNFGYLATQTHYVPGIKFPEDSLIYWRCRYVAPEGIHIGHNTIIGNDAFLDGRSGIYIGNNVNIGAECRIYTMKHNTASFTEVIGNPVTIHDWVYLANRVMIFEGVTIGEGAVVASGAIVTHDVEPWTVVAGIPAKTIRNRPIVKYTLDGKGANKLY
jgi:acetyltransferase-like isoleucine patch superfamily enzyme